MATVDAFQHWIYTHPGHTRDERTAILAFAHGPLRRHRGLERLRPARAHLWHRQLHIFEIPFYYVEYGIAQLGALQLWQASRRDLPAALDHYLAGLSLGGSRPLPELFQASGLAFDFTDKTIAPLMRNVKDALDRTAMAPSISATTASPRC
jgi:oligoendopeptidase F